MLTVFDSQRQTVATSKGRGKNNFIRDNNTNYRIEVYLWLESLYSALSLKPRFINVNNVKMKNK